MVHKIISDIEIPKYVWKKVTPLKRIKPNRAFDFETKEGKGFLLYNSDGDNVNMGNNFKQPGKPMPDDPLTGLLTFLTNKRFRASVNFFYNLDYDASAIIKFLPFADRETLRTFGLVDYDGFRIDYLPRKEFKISKIVNDAPKNSVSYYDLAQFYNFKKLAVLAEDTEYKKVFVKDISQVDIYKYYNDKDYRNLWNERCYIDCLITVDRANKFTRDVGKFVGLNAYKSKASIGRRFTLENIAHDLKMPATQMMDAALKSFHAGHIEALALGAFEDIKYYDVNGAYPHQISNLYETNSGIKRNEEYEPDSAYSFFNVLVDYYDEHVSPLWYNANGGQNYHVTGSCEVWVAKKEYEYFINHGFDVKILDARHIMKNNFSEKPFFNLIHDLYNLRLEAKEIGDEIEKIIKVITNSIFGVTLNSINKKVIEETTETDLYAIVEGGLVFYKEQYKATNMYNPVYGCDICANNRVKIYEDFKNHYNDVISINTDGVYLLCPVNVSVSNKLGEYSLDSINKLVLIGNGRYFGMRTGDTIDDKISTCRGFAHKPSDVGRELRARPDETGLELVKESPVKFAESVIQSKNYNITFSKFPIQGYNTIDMLNVFREVHKHLYFKTERRYWFNSPEKNSDIWDTQFFSRPFNVKEIV